MPAPNLELPEGCAALRIVPVTVPRVSRSYEHFSDGFDLHLLRTSSIPFYEGRNLVEGLRFRVYPKP